MLKRVASLVSVALFSVLMALPSSKVLATPLPTTGAVNSWFETSGATRLSVDFTIHGSQDGYHYYSLAPFFDGKAYGLYSGIQTTTSGPLYIFSVWNAKTAYPQDGAYKVAFTGEGEGYSLRKNFAWKLDTTYTVTLKREGFDAVNNGWRWSSTITDKSTGINQKLGEIPAPAGAATMRTGAVFHERYAGKTPVCDKTTTNLEKTSMVATNLSSDKPVTFYGKPALGGVFAIPACQPFMHATIGKNSTATAFGMTQAEFDGVLHPKAPEPSKPPQQPTKPAAQTPQVASTNTTVTSPVVPPTVQAATTTALPATGLGTATLVVLPSLVAVLTGAAYAFRNAKLVRKARWFVVQVGLMSPKAR